jgi:hypothetical protein
LQASLNCSACDIPPKKIERHSNAFLFNVA